jgi:TPR repeat protein
VRAADLGSPRAAWMVAMAYYSGTDTFPRNLTKYAHYLRIAADNGSVPAAAMLGTAYHDGEGVPQSDAAALAWEFMAKAIGPTPEGLPSPDVAINALIGIMTPEEVAQAQQIFHSLGDNWLRRVQRNRARGLGY